jgi:beta-N-acetylhexosaminidase
LVAELTALRSDVVVVEMGLPAWRPAAAATFVATYGAGRSNGQAAAELLARVP